MGAVQCSKPPCVCCCGRAVNLRRRGAGGIRNSLLIRRVKVVLYLVEKMQWTMLVTVVLVVLAGRINAESTYSGDQVWMLEDSDCNRKHASFLEMLGLAVVEDASRIRVPSQHLDAAADYLKLQNILWEVIIVDVAKHIEEEVAAHNSRQKRDEQSFDLPYETPRHPCTVESCPEPPVDRWLSYDEITSFVMSINETHHERAITTSLGKTAEGRDVWMVQVHKGTCDDSRGLYLVAGSSAREWLGVAVSMNVIWRLIYDCFVGPGHSFYIIPLLNPDGYEYSRTSGNSMWMKNRASTTDSNCPGVSLDRNFDHQWGNAGSSNEPCSDVYAGGSAMSELESQALDRGLSQCLQSNMMMSLSSSKSPGGESILLPYSWTADAVPENYTDIQNYAEIFRNASYQVYGTNYTAIPAHTAPSPHSGTFTDWAMEVHEVPMSFVVRLRGDGTYSHDPTIIYDTAKEFWEGFHELSQIIAEDVLYEEFGEYADFILRK